MFTKYVVTDSVVVADLPNHDTETVTFFTFGSREPALAISSLPSRRTSSTTTLRKNVPPMNVCVLVVAHVPPENTK